MIKRIPFAYAEPGVVHPKAVLAEWLVREGDAVETGTPLCRYEVDKASAEFASPVHGVVLRFEVVPGDRFGPGQFIITIGDRNDELATLTEDIAGDDTVPAEFDWSEVDNRGGPPEPLGVMRKAIADRMAMSKRHIPCFYLTATVDMSSCIARRNSMRKEGRKATYNDMTIRAAALALVKHPKVAAVFTPDGTVPRGDLNIGFAAALPDDGLVVPVVKQADRKQLADIAEETRRLADKAKKGLIQPADCSGGVFSVSYLGSFEVDNFVAIVNPGEAAILAVGKTQETPVAVDGRIEIRPIAKITMSSDHRSIDGALAARFMGDVKWLLEHAAEL